MLPDGVCECPVTFGVPPRWGGHGGQGGSCLFRLPDIFPPTYYYLAEKRCRETLEQEDFTPETKCLSRGPRPVSTKSFKLRLPVGVFCTCCGLAGPAEITRRDRVQDSAVECGPTGIHNPAVLCCLSASHLVHMTPRNRKPLDQDSPEFTTRFAVHLRQLVTARKFTTAGFHAALQGDGLDVSRTTVVKWLNGERLPRIGDLEHIGRVLRCRDYRMVLPPAQPE